jgi:hypothetical protein
MATCRGRFPRDFTSFVDSSLATGISTEMMRQFPVLGKRRYEETQLENIHLP